MNYCFACAGFQDRGETDQKVTGDATSKEEFCA